MITSIIARHQKHICITTLILNYFYKPKKAKKGDRSIFFSTKPVSSDTKKINLSPFLLAEVCPGIDEAFVQSLA